MSSANPFVIMVPEWAVDLFPKSVIGWTRITGDPLVGDFYFIRDGHAVDRKNCLRVMCSARIEADNKRWMHVSAAYWNKLPSYADMKDVHRIFIGNRKAIQVFAPPDEHVNINPNVLHLWSCLDDDPLPDFRIGGMI